MSKLECDFESCNQQVQMRTDFLNDSTGVFANDTRSQPLVLLLPLTTWLTRRRQVHTSRTSNAQDGATLNRCRNRMPRVPWCQSCTRRSVSETSL